MLTTLQGADEELDLYDISIQDIINSITLNDVRTFLESLGVDQVAVYEDKGYLVCPTICHNPIEEAESMKLYWYQNNKIFRCYTECNEAMSIFTLYEKFMLINYHRVSFEEAVDYVKKCISHLTISKTKKYRPPEVMDKFHIGFSLAQNKITIPHLDINGNLVGIRARTLDKEEAEEFGKYRPIQIGNVLYAHPLHFNLYGIYEHQAAIRRRQSAIIVEGEKSVLLDDDYYGEWANTVACCGSKINKYQINLLTNVLGANEITIAFDKEYTDWRTDKAYAYRKRIEDACKKYSGQAVFYYIWDINNLLEEKDSPFDKGKDVFEQLYKTRIRVR